MTDSDSAARELAYPRRVDTASFDEPDERAVPWRWQAWPARHPAWVVAGALVAAVLCAPAFELTGLHLAVGLVLVGALAVVFGALEPALIAVVATGLGLVWSAPFELPAGSAWRTAAFGLGLACATLQVAERLAVWRGAESGAFRGPRTGLFAAAVVLVLAAAVSVAPSAGLAVLLPSLAALLLAPIGTTILFLRPGSGAPRLRHLAGGLFVFVYMAVAQLVLLLLARPLLLLFVRDEARRLERLNALASAGTRALFRHFPYGRMRFLGLDSATFKRPALVVSNHQSSVDIPVVLSLSGRVALTLKKRVWDAPWLGRSARRLGHVLVEPDDPAATLERCRAALHAGRSVHFFPEGTRTLDLWPKRFHRGAFDVAIELSCPVVPIVLCDTRSAVPRDAHWVDDFDTVVEALPAVTPRTFDYTAGPRALAKHVQELIRTAFEARLASLSTPAVVRTKVRRRYRYFGRSVTRRVERELCDDAFLTALGALPSTGVVLDVGAGVGVASNVLRETKPRLRIRAFETDATDLRTASAASRGTARIELADRFDSRAATSAADGAVVRAAKLTGDDAFGARLATALRPGALLVVDRTSPDVRVRLANASFAPTEAAHVFVRASS